MKTEHCRIKGNKAICLHCGAEQTLPIPIDIRLLIALIKGFTKIHKDCKPNPKCIPDFEHIPPPPTPPEDRIIKEGGYLKPPTQTTVINKP